MSKSTKNLLSFKELASGSNVTASTVVSFSYLKTGNPNIDTRVFDLLHKETRSFHSQPREPTKSVSLNSECTDLIYQCVKIVNAASKTPTHDVKPHSFELKNALLAEDIIFRIVTTFTCNLTGDQTVDDEIISKLEKAKDEFWTKEKPRVWSINLREHLLRCERIISTFAKPSLLHPVKSRSPSTRIHSK